MPNQDHDTDVRSAVGDHQDDPAGRPAVPEQRSPSAARLLEMTARDTDQWRSDARAEAAEVVAKARQEAESLLRTAQREATNMVEAARIEAARTGEEARSAADGVRAESEKQRVDAEAEVARLQQVAADHSRHLRRHLNGVLDQLDSVPSQPTLERGDGL